MDVVTAEVAAALDRTNTSDIKSAHIFLPLHQLGSCNKLDIRSSAIRRARMKHGERFMSEIKASLDPAVPLVLHWDGKIKEDFTGPGRDQIYWLPILVSGQNVVKLLSVPKRHDEIALKMTRAVVDSTDEWGLRNRIKYLCFDATASNTGGKDEIYI